MPVCSDTTAGGVISAALTLAEEVCKPFPEAGFELGPQAVSHDFAILQKPNEPDFAVQMVATWTGRAAERLRRRTLRLVDPQLGLELADMVAEFGVGFLAAR